MMHTYFPQGICPRQLDIELDGKIIKYVKFYGGCHGNTQAWERLAPGMNIDELYAKVGDIKCGMKPASCPGILAKACMQAYREDQAALQKDAE